jgi:hypothetical protein
MRPVQLKDVLVRRLPVRVMLAAHHERRAGNLLAANPPAAFGVAVNAVPGGQDAGQQGHLAEVRAEPDQNAYHFPASLLIPVTVSTPCQRAVIMHRSH